MPAIVIEFIFFDVNILLALLVGSKHINVKLNVHSFFVFVCLFVCFFLA